MSIRASGGLTANRGLAVLTVVCKSGLCGGSRAPGFPVRGGSTQRRPTLNIPERHKKRYDCGWGVFSVPPGRRKCTRPRAAAGTQRYARHCRVTTMSRAQLASVAAAAATAALPYVRTLYGCFFSSASATFCFPCSTSACRRARERGGALARAPQDAARALGFMASSLTSSRYGSARR